MRPTLTLLMLIVIAAPLPSCSRLSKGGWEPVSEGPVAAVPNPLPVPFFSRELVMDEVSDEIEDYFRILREQRVRLTGDILTEGFIDTVPRIGSTILEPWRRDSTPGFERVHASLQTIRRWARVRVIPTANQYLIDVKVYKELEDLEEPMQSSLTGQPFRQDNVLDHDLIDNFVEPPNLGWIPMGRDFSLEQRILANLNARFERAAANGATCVR